MLHGHGGYFNGELLGTFGDISISSPRKIINIYSGRPSYDKSKKPIFLFQIFQIINHLLQK